MRRLVHAIGRLIPGIREILAAEGWPGLERRLGARLRRLWILNEEFIVREFDLTTLVPRYTLRLSSKTTVRPMSAEDLPSLSKRLEPREMRNLRKRMAGHEKEWFGFLVLVEGRIVGHFGLVVRRAFVKELRYGFKMGPKLVYSNGMVIDPDCRMTVVPAALAEYAYLFFKERGFNKTVNITQSTNRSSLRFTENFGFREVHRFISKRVLLVRLRPLVAYGGTESSPTPNRRLPAGRPRSADPGKQVVASEEEPLLGDR